jgi:2-hydroxyglutaryl-CoA dehydratase, D-component
MSLPRKLSLSEWDTRYVALRAAGLQEPWYGGALSRHVSTEGDFRLQRLRFDNSAAALRLWNFLLTENQRLHKARREGERIVGAMKDLGTVPVLAYSLPRVRAFYPDGAWWTPCLMECSDGLLQQAAALGIDGSFCPVRAMLAAFQNGEHFPRPDLLVCSAGSVCDDFSAIAQRLERLGFPVVWWEMPRRRQPDPDEPGCPLPGGFVAPEVQVECVREELRQVASELGRLAGRALDDRALAEGIRQANVVRGLVERLRVLVYGSAGAPLPALEMLVAEMLAIHFCSDRQECIGVLSELLAEAESRSSRREFIIPSDAVRVFWVNPVADLRAMNLLEDWGGRICGSDYMFAHALAPIPEDLPPLEALARTALADPMVGSTQERARRIVSDCRAFRAEAVVVSRIPGASHCAREGALICEIVRTQLGLPTVELEIPPVCDAMSPTIGSRLQALIETAREKRRAGAA